MNFLSAWILRSFRRVTSRVGFSLNSQKFSHLDPTLCISPSTCTLKLRSALEHAMIGTTIRWGFSKVLRKWRQPPHMVSNRWSGFCANKFLLHETLCIHKDYNAEPAMAFYWLYFWGIRKGKGHQRQPSQLQLLLLAQLLYKVWLGVVPMCVLYFTFFDFILFVVTYGAPVEDFKAKAWERIWRRQWLLHELSTKSHKLFVSTSRIAPIGGTIFEVKHTLQLQE